MRPFSIYMRSSISTAPYPFDDMFLLKNSTRTVKAIVMPSECSFSNLAKKKKKKSVEVGLN
jgi:hypothetical protein